MLPLLRLARPPPSCVRSIATSSRLLAQANPPNTSKVDVPPAPQSTPPPGGPARGPEPPDVRASALAERLRLLSEGSAASLRKRIDAFTAQAMVTFSQLGGKLNHATGYEEIDTLKKKVREQEIRIEETRNSAREAKLAYDEAVAQRAQSQRDVNDLLQRKSTWRDDDVARFTKLVREDHLYEQAETRAKEAVAHADGAVEREFTVLMRAILDRYHEEQVWSDKIRSASTYGSLAALGLNMLIFLIAIFVTEPWKRKRLAQTFERKVEEMSAQTRAVVESGLRDLETHMAEQERRMLEMATARRADEPDVAPLPPADAAEDAPSVPAHRGLDYTLLATSFVAAVVGLAAGSFFGR